MKPKEIICVGTILGVIGGVVAVILLMLGVIKFITGAENYLTYFVCGAITVIPIAVLDIITTRAKDKIDPLNINKQRMALEYVVCNVQGKKADFIQEHSEVMYNHFIEKGYIHSPLSSNETGWEVTVLGQKTWKRLKPDK